MIRRVYSKRKQAYVWKLDIYVKNGAKKRRARVAVFETRRQAEEALAIIRRREKEERYGITPQIDLPLLSQLITRRLERIESKKERTRAARVLNVWLDLLPAGIAITEVTTPLVMLYANLRRDEGQAPASIRRELSIIGATLNSAVEFFSELAQWRPPKVPRPNVSKSRRDRIIYDAEANAMLTWLTRPPDEVDGKASNNRQSAYEARLRVAAIFRFALRTGMRPGEIYRLRWEDIQWEKGRIQVRGQKTEKRVASVRHVPLSGSIQAILDERQKVSPPDCQFVFTRGGNPAPKIYRILREAAQAAGLPYSRHEANGIELACARHTFATKLIESGIDLRTVGEIMGHTMGYMTLHYAHVTPASWQRAQAAIDSIP